MKSIKAFKLFAKGFKKLSRFACKNSNWILALIASIGAGVVAEEFTRATIKAVKLCEEKKVKGKKEIVKTVWKLYIPGIGALIVVVSSICGNAHINAKRLAAVTGLYAASQTDLATFKKKAQEILGEGKARKVEEDAEREKVDANPPPAEDQIAKTGHGNDLFMLGWTGKYFRSNPEWIALKFRDLNEEIDSYDEAEANSIIEALEMEPCDSGLATWNKYEMTQHGFSKVEADITSCKWMEVNGKKEMVSTLRFKPNPSWM